MKKLLLIISAIAFAAAAYASKAMSGLRPLLQKDGTTLMVRSIGDEYFSYQTTADGVLLCWDADCYCVAKVETDGKLTSTGIVAHEKESRNPEELAAIEKQDKQIFIRELDRNATSERRKAFGDWNTRIKFVPHKGHIRVPVIMVDFPDRGFTFSKEEIHDLYMGSHEKADRPQRYTSFKTYGSAREFFYESSLGQLDFEFDFYGIYTLPQEHKYYGNNTKASISRVLKDALPMIDDDIDFSQYDNDGDGVCDIVYFIYAGTGANVSNDLDDIWASCGYGYNADTNDGVKLYRCGMSNELLVADGNTQLSDRKARMSGVGVFCHEMSHGLGLPDLYCNSNSWKTLDNNGPEDWDLMDNGENVRYGYWQPLHSLWERVLLGWIEPTELTEPQDVTVYPLNDEEGRGKAYIIKNPANKDEFWTIENIPSTGWYAGMHGGGTGIIIGHVNYSDAKFLNLNKPNDVFGKPNCTILPADDYIISSYYEGSKNADGVEISTTDYINSLRGDTYPGSKGVTSLAAYKNYTGEEDLVNSLPITDIRLNDDGSVSFRFGEPEPSGISTIGSKRSDNVTYTLDGRRISTTGQHGIYIRNGKKYVK